MRVIWVRCLSDDGAGRKHTQRRSGGRRAGYVLGGDSTRSQHTPQSGAQYKAYELFTSGISYLIFSDQGGPLVTETAGSKTTDEGTQYLSTWDTVRLCSRGLPSCQPRVRMLASPRLLAECWQTSRLLPRRWVWICTSLIVRFGIFSMGFMAMCMSSSVTLFLPSSILKFG